MEAANGTVNPDEAARRFLSVHPGMTQEKANGAAWQEGKRLLELAISERLEVAFETTLGGRTMAALLHRAPSEKTQGRIWYVRLASPPLQLSRGRSKTAPGGRDIPETKI